MLEAEKRKRSFNTSIEKTKVLESRLSKISPIFENMVLGAELKTYCWRLQEWSQSSPPASASRFPQSPRPESKRRRKLDRNWCIILLKLPLAGGFCFHIFTYQMLEKHSEMLWISAMFHKLPKIFCWLAVYLGWVIGTPNFTQWLAFRPGHKWQFLLPKHHVNSPFLVA